MDLSVFFGTGTAIVTPFDAHENIDFDALERLINFQVENKVEYIVSMGTTGETPVLNNEERMEIMQYTYKVVAGRVPVVVGIGGNETRELLHQLTTFPLDGATAILSASPYYNKPSQEGIYRHYEELAKASTKPIILYNVPGRTGRNMGAKTTLRLALLKNIVGIKEASGDLAQCMQILKDKPDDFLVVSGDDALALPQLACGMKGVISVAANAFPLEFSNMVRECLRGNFTEAVKINNTLISAYELMFKENNPAGVKGFLAANGLIENYLRLPNVPVSDNNMQGIKDYISAHK